MIFMHKIFAYKLLSVAKLAKARDCNGFVILRSGVRLTPGRLFFFLLGMNVSSIYILFCANLVRSSK